MPGSLQELEVFFFQIKALGVSCQLRERGQLSQQRERGTQTEERVDGDLDPARTRGEEREIVKGGPILVKNNLKGEGKKEEGEVVEMGKRRSSELGRKVTLSKSFSRLLSFRRVKK